MGCVTNHKLSFEDWLKTPEAKEKLTFSLWLQHEEKTIHNVEKTIIEGQASKMFAILEKEGPSAAEEIKETYNLYRKNGPIYRCKCCQHERSSCATDPCGTCGSTYVIKEV